MSGSLFQAGMHVTKKRAAIIKALSACLSLFVFSLASHLIIANSYFEVLDEARLGGRNYYCIEVNSGKKPRRGAKLPET